MIVYREAEFTVERRGSVATRDLRFVVIDKLGRVQQVYPTLTDAKRGFFGVGLN